MSTFKVVYKLPNGRMLTVNNQAPSWTQAKQHGAWLVRSYYPNKTIAEIAALGRASERKRK